ncbi:MAG: hypothetical protein DSY33_06150 [Archaeoglobus sp.]|jgi:uncharacterized protein with ATP-grasp and redox domains|nr:MAG: hypothetical protein DSY33_06150 [Archaeoglobus sp.]
MKITPVCPACLINRARIEAEMVTEDKEVVYKAVEEALKVLSRRFPERGINAIIATEMHRKVYEIIGCDDPYAEVKRSANELVMKHLPEIKAIFEKEGRFNRFKASVIASIIGNTFDYGVMGHEVSRDFMSYFSESFMKGLKIDDTDKIRELCRGKVVYLTDNAGEIVLDTLLMKEIKKICERLTVVVRGRPILSDATIEDAKLCGVDRIADEILTNGKGAIGIIPEELPDITMERIESADIIVAKGMANYECLSDSDYSNVAFLLTAKCKPVAEDIGVDVGDMVAMLKG